MEDAVADVDLPLGEQQGNGPEVELLVLAQGLYHGPTGDCEGDDCQDTIAVGADSGKCGIRGRSTLEPLDACNMLKLQRLGFAVQNKRADSRQGGVSGDFDFVPDLVMALLMSLFTDEAQIRRMLSQTWVREWEGWKEWDKSRRNEGCLHLPEDSFAEELVRRLVTISMAQAEVNYPSDADELLVRLSSAVL